MKKDIFDYSMYDNILNIIHNTNTTCLITNNDNHNIFNDNELIINTTNNNFLDICGNISIIYNEITNNIPENIKNEYKNEFIHIKELLTDVIIDKFLYNQPKFDIRRKLTLFILLFLSKLCHNIIPLLLQNMEKETIRELITENDHNGNNLIFHTCCYDKSFNEILKYTTKEMLFIKNKMDVTVIDISILIGTVDLIITNGVITIDELYNYKKESLSLLHLIFLLNNENSIKYFLQNEINPIYLTTKDRNDNIPILILCLNDNLSMIEQIISTDVNICEYLDITNINKESLLTYIIKKKIVHKLIHNNYLTNTFIKKTYNIFTDYYSSNINKNEYITFIQSKYFNEEILCYEQNTDINKFNLLEIILQNITIIDELINIKEERDKIIEILTNIIKQRPKYFGLLCYYNPEIGKQLIDEKKIPIDTLLIKNYNYNTYEYIIKNKSKKSIELLRTIIYSQYYNTDHLTIDISNVSEYKYLLTFILTNIPQSFIKLLTNNDNNKNIKYKELCEKFVHISQKEITKTSQNFLIDMINYNIINKDIIKDNNYELLRQIFHTNNEISAILLSDIIDDTINLLQFLGEDISIEVFTLIINHKLITKEIINNKEIINEIKKKYFNGNKLSILIETRNDFNKEILYDNELIKYLLNNDQVDKIDIILDGISYEKYINLYEIINYVSVPIVNNFAIKLYEHKYFNTETLNTVKYMDNGDNILMRFLKLNLKITQNILNSKYLTSSIFMENNNYEENIFIYCIVYNYLENEIINHRFFNDNMIIKTDKFMNKISKLIELIILKKYFNYEIIKFMIKKKIIDKTTIEKYNILEIIISHGYIKEIFDIIEILGDAQILLNKIEKTSKHTILSLIFNSLSGEYHNNKRLYIEELQKIGLDKKYILYENDSTIITNLICKHSYLFADIINKMNITQRELIHGQGNYFAIGMFYNSNLYKEISIDLLSNGEIFKSKLNNDKPCIFIIDMSYEYFTYFINYKNTDLSFIYEEYNDETYLEILLKKDERFGQLYYSSDKMDLEPLYINDYKLLNRIVIYYPEILNIILNKININENITIKNKIIISSLSCIYLDENNIPKSFKYICDKINGKDLLNDYENKPIIMYINKNCFNYILKNINDINDILNESMLHHDIYGNPLIIYLKHNIEYQYEILKRIKIEHFKSHNNCGQTILHYIAREYSNILINILDDSKLYFKLKKENIIYIKDIFGKMYIDYIFEMNNIDNIKYIINKNLIDCTIISNIDYSGNTLLSKMLINGKDNDIIIEYIKKMICNEVLSIRDYNGITNFFHIIKHSTNILKYICDNIKLLNIDIKIFDNIDNNARTCLMIAAEYNINSLEELLKMDIIESKHFMVHNNMGSCLTKAVKYNPQAIKLIYESNIINQYDEILKCRENDFENDSIINMNIIQLACKYNSDSLLPLLCINKLNILNEFIYEILYVEKNVYINSLKLAIIYQPDAITTLLQSKYFRHELIEQTNNICITSCLIDSLHYQPFSFVKLLKLNKMDQQDIYYNNSNPFKEFNDLFINSNSNYITSDTDFEKMFPLLKIKNEKCDNKCDNICTICYSNKSNILLTNCYHQCCIICSLQITKCPICNNLIINKLPLHIKNI